MDNEFRDVSFFYYRSDTFNLTVAYKRATNHSSVIYGVSFCRGKTTKGRGDQFSKPRGRQIAEGRMNNGGVMLATSTSSTRFDTHDAILRDIQDNPDFFGTPRNFEYKPYIPGSDSV